MAHGEGAAVVVRGCEEWQPVGVAASVAEEFVVCTHPQPNSTERWAPSPNYKEQLVLNEKFEIRLFKITPTTSVIKCSNLVPDETYFITMNQLQVAIFLDKGST